MEVRIFFGQERITVWISDIVVVTVTLLSCWKPVIIRTLWRLMSKLFVQVHIWRHRPFMLMKVFCKLAISLMRLPLLHGERLPDAQTHLRAKVNFLDFSMSIVCRSDTPLFTEGKKQQWSIWFLNLPVPLWKQTEVPKTKTILGNDNRPASVLDMYLFANSIGGKGHWCLAIECKTTSRADPSWKDFVLIEHWETKQTIYFCHFVTSLPLKKACSM